MAASAAKVGYLPSCTYGTAGVFSRRRLCLSPTSPVVWSPVNSHKYWRWPGKTWRLKLRAPHLCQQQEVVEEETIELFAAFGFEQLPAVKELPGTQAVGDRVKHELLEDTQGKIIREVMERSGEKLE